MARICVISNAIVPGGGIFTKLTAFFRYAASRNHVCDFHFPAVNGYPKEEAEILKKIGTIDRFCPIPVPRAVPHFIRGIIFGKRCDISGYYDAYQLVCGSTYIGIPFDKKNVRFVAWPANPAVIEIKPMPRKKIRHYYFYNSLSNYMITRQESSCVRKAACVIAQTRVHAYNLQSTFGITNQNICLMPNPVDTERFSPVELGDGSHRYILTVTRLEREKDVPTLIRSFRLVNERHPEVELRVVGDGKERRALERQVKDLRLERSVVFLGLLRGEALVQQYRGASLCAFSSPQESFGNVYVEAMACGKPIVSTDSGAVHDHIDHGRSGFVVPPYDSSGLAEYILKILDDPVLAANIGRLNREKAVSDYSLHKFYERMDSVYRRVFEIPSHGQ